MGIFNNLFSSNTKESEFGGDHITAILRYFKLLDWWNSEFTEEERKHIVEIYQPFGAGYSTGNEDIFSTSSKELDFLFTLSGWFKKREDRDIAKRILAKSSEFLDSSKDIINKHFYYQSVIQTYYPERDENPEALPKVIKACEDQIAIAPEVAKAFLKDMGLIPAHTGYQQLSIILTKQNKYKEAIEVASKAKSEGWNGDWDDRIESYKKAEGKVK